MKPRYCITCTCGKHLMVHQTEQHCPTCGALLVIEWHAEQSPSSEPRTITEQYE